MLSLLVLFSTLSLTIDKHFCGDVLIDVAIFSQSEKCGVEAYKMAQQDNLEKSCCKNEIDVIEGLSETIINTSDDLETIHQQFLMAFSIAYTRLYTDFPNVVIPHKSYLAPVLVKDLQLLDETFLI